MTITVKPPLPSAPSARHRSEVLTYIDLSYIYIGGSGKETTLRFKLAETPVMGFNSEDTTLKFRLTGIPIMKFNL